MPKFKVVKKLSLDFLGEGWKDTYINFNALTIGDIKDKFPALTEVDIDNSKSIIKGMETVLGVMKEKFIDGKVPDEKGALVPLKVEELKDLPIEVMKRSLDFLSQGVNTP